MLRSAPNDAPRKMPLPRGIRDVHPGGTHTSSPHDAANLGKHLVAGNRLHATGANLIATPDCLRSPESLYLIGLVEVQALDNPLREQSSRCGRKLHRFISELIQCE